MKIRITPAIQREFEDPIADALAGLKCGARDPSDGVYIKVYAAMQTLKRPGPVSIDADEAEAGELKSRAEYEVGPNGVCAENISYSSDFRDRLYWLCRKRAYTALLRQITGSTPVVTT